MPNIITEVADDVENCFTTLEHSDFVSILAGITEEAANVVGSGDLASSGLARKLGTVAAGLLGILKMIPPEQFGVAPEARPAPAYVPEPAPEVVHSSGAIPPLSGGTVSAPGSVLSGGLTGSATVTSGGFLSGTP